MASDATSLTPGGDGAAAGTAGAAGGAAVAASASPANVSASGAVAGGVGAGEKGGEKGGQKAGEKGQIPLVQNSDGSGVSNGNNKGNGTNENNNGSVNNNGSITNPNGDAFLEVVQTSHPLAALPLAALPPLDAFQHAFLEVVQKEKIDASALAQWHSFNAVLGKAEVITAEQILLQWVKDDLDGLSQFWKQGEEIIIA
jgi:hypothetical protein